MVHLNARMSCQMIIFFSDIQQLSLFQTYHITLELGHKAEILAHIWDNPSHIVAEQESTHQWECWVNAKVGNMSKYVDKVVFNLHETFPKPKRGKYLFKKTIFKIFQKLRETFKSSYKRTYVT